MERVNSVAIVKTSRCHHRQRNLRWYLLIFAVLALRVEGVGDEPWRWIRAELSKDGRYVAFTNSPITFGDSYGGALTNYLVLSPSPSPNEGETRALTSADILSDRMAMPTNANPPAAVAEPIYSADQWNAWHGLPSNRVRALEQTREGYLWIGTLHGLARFDGVRFTIFNSVNTPELAPSDDIRHLAEGDDGSLWIGTGRGLVRYREGRFAREDDPLIRDARVLALNFGRRSGLWVGTVDGAIRRQQGRYIRVMKQSAAFLRMFEPPTGPVLLLFDSATVWYDPIAGAHSVVAGEPREAAMNRAAILDRTGRIWVGGVYLSNFKDASLQSASAVFPLAVNFTDSKGPIWDLEEDRLGQLWCVAGEGPNNVYRIVDGHAIRCVPVGAAIASARCLKADRDGNLWIGTYGSGLVRLRRQPMETFHFGARTLFAKIQTLAEGTDGSLWMGTEGGIVHWAGRTITSIGLTTTESKARGAFPVARGRSGRVWAAHPESGIIPLPTHPADSLWMQPIHALLPEVGRVRVLLQQDNGPLWLGTDNGLVRWDGQIRRWTAKDGLPDAAVRALTEDPSGRIWIGTERGVTLFHGTGLTTIASNAVNALHVDSACNIWVGGKGGLSLIAGGDGGGRFQDCFSLREPIIRFWKMTVIGSG